MSEAINIGAFSESLNNKVDLDLANVVNEGTSRGASWSMPSNTYINLTLGEDGEAYTAPANGYFIIQKRVGTNNSEYVVMDNSTTGMKQERNNNISGNNLSIYMPFKKGDVCQVWYNASGILELFRFYYAEGSKGEASN